jgi:pyrimidine-nucleoside phosphorylase
MRKGDPIDHAVGIIVHNKVGDYVEKGEPLFAVHARTGESADRAIESVLASHTWTDSLALPLFYDVITG